jgi:hypothetical protein
VVLAVKHTGGRRNSAYNGCDSIPTDNMRNSHAMT